MENSRIADIFEEIADLIELKGGNEFRVRAYRSSARTLRDHPRRIEDMLAEGEDLSELPDVGESTAEKIEEIVERGTCKRLEDLREDVPRGLIEVMHVHGVGAKKAARLHDELEVASLEELEKAASEGRVRELSGFGERSEEKILDGIKTLSGARGRLPWIEAREQVERFSETLAEIDAIEEHLVAGSYRRAKETVGDLDVVVLASERKKAGEAIGDAAQVARVESRGEEKVTLHLDSGLQVDVRFFDEQNLGAALLYFTGSKDHNVALRRIAQDRDWKLNEYGLFRGDKLLAGREEEAIYARLNLAYIPPELRENRGEIEAAASDALPRLIELEHVKGDFHAHTKATDGKNTIRQMADAARARGYEYLAITDHSKRVSMAGGLDDEACRKHADAIRAANEDLDDLWLLAGIECDILKSGKLDLKDKTLRELDWVVGSVHYDRNLDEEEMTKRLLAAVESGLIHALGHPLGRMIGEREPMSFDTERVFEACAKNKVFVEINAQPERLDLPDTHTRQAKEAGVEFVLSTDAHRTTSLGMMQLAINVARRGWLERGDVINTISAKALRRRLGR